MYLIMCLFGAELGKVYVLFFSPPLICNLILTKVIIDFDIFKEVYLYFASVYIAFKLKFTLVRLALIIFASFFFTTIHEFYCTF